MIYGIKKDCTHEHIIYSRIDDECEKNVITMKMVKKLKKKKSM